MKINMTSHVTGLVNITIEDMMVTDEGTRKDLFEQLEALAILVANDGKKVEKTTLTVIK